MGFFDKILDKFGSPEATREMLEKLYAKYRKKALKRNDSPYDAHIDAISRMLVGRCASPLNPYKVNRAKLMSETYPFLQNGPNVSVPLIIEYILYLENDPSAKKVFLSNGINNIMEEFLEKESELGQDMFYEHLAVIKEAISSDIPWTRLVYVGHLKKILNDINNDSNQKSKETGIEKEVSEKEVHDSKIRINDSKTITIEMLKIYEAYGGDAYKLKEKGTEKEKKVMSFSEFSTINSLKQYAHILNNNFTSDAFSEKIVNLIVEKTSGNEAIKYLSERAWQIYANNKS